MAGIICLADGSQRLEKRRLEALFGLVDFNQASKIGIDELVCFNIALYLFQLISLFDYFRPCYLSAFLHH